MNKQNLNDAKQVLEDIEEDEAHLTLMRGLQFLSSVQEVTSNLVDKAIPPEGQQPSLEQIRTYFLALMGETYELMNELNWKPWKKQLKIPDSARVTDEFADMLAFLGVIIVFLERMGIDPEDLAKAYIKKTRVNVERFVGDY